MDGEEIKICGAMPKNNDSIREEKRRKNLGIQFLLFFHQSSTFDIGQGRKKKRLQSELQPSLVLLEV